MNSNIGLNPTPVLDANASIGNEDVSLGGEVGFDTASASFTKYNAGITFNRPDFSAALILYVLLNHFLFFLFFLVGKGAPLVCDGSLIGSNNPLVIDFPSMEVD